MPSNSGPVNFELMYCRTGAPFNGASLGIVKLASGCADAALLLLSRRSPPRTGVPVLPTPVCVWKGAGLYTS